MPISTKFYQQSLNIALLIDSHAYDTDWPNLVCLALHPLKAKLHGRNSVNNSAIYSFVPSPTTK